jgi:hypothetical protein
MEGQMESLLQLKDKKDDIMLKDFVTKRSTLFNELMRSLSVKCMHTCEVHGKTDALSADGVEKETHIPDFAQLEQ